MALSAFEDPAQPPSSDERRHALGSSANRWAALLEHVQSAHGPFTELWRHAGAKFGWSLRLMLKERVILYLTPQRGAFLVGLALGERAAQSAEAGSLPPLALEALLAAPKCAEGRGVRLSVTSDAELEAAQALIPYKLLVSAPRASRKSAAKPRRA